jgi:hypothetical protein
VNLAVGKPRSVKAKRRACMCNTSAFTIAQTLWKRKYFARETSPRSAEIPLFLGISPGSFSDEPITDRQGEHGLRVLDPSVLDHGEGLVPGDDHGLESLIDLEVRGARFQIFAQE